MAANARVHAAPGWVDGELLTHTQVNALDAGHAVAVIRKSTTSGWKQLPLNYIGSSDLAGLEHGLYTIHGVTKLRANPAGSIVDVAFAVELPHGHVLDTIRVDLYPAGGHGGQPASLPAIKLWRTDIAGAATLIGSDVYAWIDVPTYEGGITLELTGLTETIDKASYRYILNIYGESGANSVTGTTLGMCRAHMTIDSSEGGPDLRFFP